MLFSSNNLLNSKQNSSNHRDEDTIKQSIVERLSTCCRSLLCRVDRIVCFWSSRLAFDSELVEAKILKLVFTASPLDSQRYRDVVENKPASLLIVLLGKALNEIPLFLE